MYSLNHESRGKGVSRIGAKIYVRICEGASLLVIPRSCEESRWKREPVDLRRAPAPGEEFDAFLIFCRTILWPVGIPEGHTWAMDAPRSVLWPGQFNSSSISLVAPGGLAQRYRVLFRCDRASLLVPFGVVRPERPSAVSRVRPRSDA